MFKAIVSADTLGAALDSVSVLVDECKIRLDEEGLTIRAVDHPDVRGVDRPDFEPLVVEMDFALVNQHTHGVECRLKRIRAHDCVEHLAPSYDSIP